MAHGGLERNRPLELSISVEKVLETGHMDRVKSWGTGRLLKDESRHPEDVIHPCSPAEWHSIKPLGIVAAILFCPQL